MFRLLLLVTLFVPSFAVTANASDIETPYQITERLQQKYESITSLSFHFSQKTESALGGRPQAGSGEAYFLRNNENGKMRWNYFTPDQQVLISDGETFSMYFSTLKQMIIAPASSMESQIAYSFFTGSADITKDFLVFIPDETVAIDDQNDSFNVIKLVPKEVQSQIKDIHLWVTDKSLIQRMEIRDHFDTLTILNLSNIQINTLDSLPDNEKQALFSFTPPEHTEIIRQ